MLSQFFEKHRSEKTDWCGFPQVPKTEQKMKLKVGGDNVANIVCRNGIFVLTEVFFASKKTFFAIKTRKSMIFGTKTILGRKACVF